MTTYIVTVRVWIVRGVYSLDYRVRGKDADRAARAVRLALQRRDYDVLPGAQVTVAAAA